MYLKLKLILVVFFIGFNLISSNISEANTKNNNKFGSDLNLPAMIEADKIRYNNTKKVAIAYGNVQITQGDKVLLADSLVYNQNTNIVKAKGNVSFLEQNGNVLFADDIELKDDLKAGVVDGFGAILSDGSKIAANKAIREDDNITVLEKVVYSPCTLCKKDPLKAPLWQVKAKRATIDQENQRVKYNHAFFEIKGFPVFYSPYISHATPDADRKSGFLIPKYSTDDIFGTMIKTPYYYNISPNKDLTLSPTFTTNEGVILEGKYRHLLSSGQYSLSASLTNPDKVDENGNHISGNEIRGHIEGEGEFEINDSWKWGFEGKRSTDDTYLRRYDFSDEDVLTARAYVNQVSGRNYSKIESITFQGLNEEDDPGKTPLILPVGKMHLESDKSENGSNWALDGNILALLRDEGVTSRRVSLEGSWNLPYVTDSGNIFSLKTSLRTDGYYVDSVLKDPSDSTSESQDGLTSRIVPQAELKWSLPLAKPGENRQFFFEPVANFILSPYGGNPDKIPNEDSQDIEFSDDNLFYSNHFTGYDLIENGPRINYGMRARVEDYKYGNLDLIFGQNYRARKDNNFNSSTGLDDNFSDLVGRVAYQKGDFFDASYRFRVDKDSWSLNKNAVSTEFKFSPFKFGLDYVSIDEYYDNQNDEEGESRKTLIANSSVDLTKNWTLSGDINRNIEEGDWISTKASLFYKGDCIDIGTSWEREYTRDRDVEPNTTFSVQIFLRNLGY